MKVYMVTTGCYSEYRVNGVYSTKEAAEYAHSLYNSGNEIEELTVDELPDHPRGLASWLVLMDGDGNTRDVHKTDPMFSNESVRYYAAGLGWFRENNDCMVFTMWAKDKDHAVKVANETRIMLKACGNWDKLISDSKARRRAIESCPP